eukprot:gene7935-12404_t
MSHYLFIGNLDQEVDKNTLEKYFAKYNPVKTKITYRTRHSETFSLGQAIMEFKTKETMEQVIISCNGKSITHNREDHTLLKLKFEGLMNSLVELEPNFPMRARVFENYLNPIEDKNDLKEFKELIEELNELKK